MEWVLSVLVLVLAYLTFASSARQVGGLRNIWLLLAGVMGVQALAALIATIDSSELYRAQPLLLAVSWGLLAFAVFNLVNAALPTSAAAPAAAPQAPPAAPPTPPAAPPAGPSNF